MNTYISQRSEFAAILKIVHHEQNHLPKNA